jgi:hypothetical protein
VAPNQVARNPAGIAKAIPRASPPGEERYGLVPR